MPVKEMLGGQALLGQGLAAQAQAMSASKDRQLTATMEGKRLEYAQEKDREDRALAVQDRRDANAWKRTELAQTERMSRMATFQGLSNNLLAQTAANRAQNTSMEFFKQLTATRGEMEQQQSLIDKTVGQARTKMDGTLEAIKGGQVEGVLPAQSEDVVVWLLGSLGGKVREAIQSKIWGNLTKREARQAIGALEAADDAISAKLGAVTGGLKEKMAGEAPGFWEKAGLGLLEKVGFRPEGTLAPTGAKASVVVDRLRMMQTQIRAARDDLMRVTGWLDPKTGFGPLKPHLAVSKAVADMQPLIQDNFSAAIGGYRQLFFQAAKGLGFSDMQTQEMFGGMTGGGQLPTGQASQAMLAPQAQR